MLGGENDDNLILVGKGLNKFNCSKNIRKSPILDIAPYAISSSTTVFVHYKLSYANAIYVTNHRVAPGDEFLVATEISRVA